LSDLEQEMQEKVTLTLPVTLVRRIEHLIDGSTPPQTVSQYVSSLVRKSVTAAEPATGQDFTEEDSLAIRERLKDLGYL
jgi:hypothetical protein